MNGVPSPICASRGSPVLMLLSIHSVKGERSEKETMVAYDLLIRQVSDGHDF